MINLYLKLFRIPKIRKLASFGLLLIGMSLTGCGGREFAEVEGRITLDGKPLADVQIVFLPDPAKGNKANNSSATADANGYYRLYATRDERSGTVLGSHRIVIIDLTMVSDTTGAGDPPGIGKMNAGLPGSKPRRFPKAYGEANDTPFRDVEVSAGKQTLDFDLTSKGAEGNKSKRSEDNK
jgi:hypothetical protein